MPEVTLRVSPNLGDRVKDAVTGFTGIVLSRTKWMYGCVRLHVLSETLHKNGTIVPPQVFDEPQLEVVQTGVVQRHPMPAVLHSPQLGDRVKDRVTGFTGIVMAQTEWLYSCTRIVVSSETLQEDKEKTFDGYAFDEPQLEVVEVGALQAKSQPHPEAAKATATGGDRPSVTRHADPQR